MVRLILVSVAGADVASVACADEGRAGELAGKIEARREDWLHVKPDARGIPHRIRNATLAAMRIEPEPIAQVAPAPPDKPTTVAVVDGAVQDAQEGPQATAGGNGKPVAVPRAEPAPEGAQAPPTDPPPTA